MRKLERAGALFALPLAFLLTGVALNVLLVSKDVAADDFRFQTSAARQTGLWEDPGLLAASPTARGLGLEDDLAYRRAVSLFARVRPGRAPYPTPRLAALRGQAALELTRTSRGESDPRRRSQLLNFLAVLPLDRRISDQGERANVLQTAIGLFQSAVRVDPENADAKLNLELVLRISNVASVPANQPSGERSGGERSGAGGLGGGY